MNNKTGAKMNDTMSVSRVMLQQVLDALEIANSRDGGYSYGCEIDAIKAVLEADANTNVNKVND